MAGEAAGQMDLFAAGISVAPPAVHEPKREPPADPVAPRSEPAAVAPMLEPASASGIEDAGQELVYNRRNRIRAAKTWADLVALNPALRLKEATKANIWLKPDYKALIEGGLQPLCAHIVKQVYDSVANTPTADQSGVVAEERLRAYVDVLGQVERGVMAWTEDTEALRQWVQENAKVAGAMLGRRIELSELAGKPKRSLLDIVFGEGGWKAHREGVRAAGGNRLLGALQPGYEEIERALKAIDKGWPEKREAWQIQGYRIVAEPAVEIIDARSSEADRKTYYYVQVAGQRWPLVAFDTREGAQRQIAEFGPVVLFNKRNRVHGWYASHDDAVAAARDAVGRERGEAVSDKGERVAAVERHGTVRRLEGEDVSSQRLMDEFGFKGVNFGNWMKAPSARAEAQLHLNHAFDSLHDLAQILNLPPRALSLNGMLGLAIGAQGNGGTTAAHFVPGVDEINLTRTSGAGSLAHEWGHGLDHYLAALAGLASAPAPYLTEHVGLAPLRQERHMVNGVWTTRAVPRFGEIRPEIVAAVKSIMEAINKRGETPEEAAQGIHDGLAKAEKHRDGWLTAIDRSFGGAMEAPFNALVQRMREGDLGDGLVAVSRSTYLSPVVCEMRDLYKTHKGHLFSLEEAKALQAWLDAVRYKREHAEVEPDQPARRVRTNYANDALALDKKKGGKRYWSTDVEKFARAFDAFVSDEQTTRAITNGYLSHQGRDGPTVPLGAEREAINAAFRVLVGEVKTRETERGVALFSLGDGVAQNAGASVSWAGSNGSAPAKRAAFEAGLGELRQRWPGMPPVLMADRVSDLPFWAPAHCDGAYCRGRSYAVVENIASMRQFYKVMAHECVLHHGFEDMLGHYGFSKVHEGIQQLKAKGDPTIVGLAEEVRRAYGALTPHAETRELVARAGERCLDERGNLKIGFGFMKPVFAGVAGWLRDRGIPVAFSNFELQGLMRAAGQWVERGPELSRSGAAVVTQGRFSGKIIEVVNGLVRQRTGRDGATVTHDAARLSLAVKVGDVADIAYSDGHGMVAAHEREMER